MDEAKWLVSAEPLQLLEFLRGKISARKSRLFAVACCRRLGGLVTNSGWVAINAAERFADGLIDRNELNVAWAAVGFPKKEPRALAAAAVRWASCSSLEYDGTRDAAAFAIHALAIESEPTNQTPETENSTQCKLLRDLVGDLFRPVAVYSAWLTWNNATIPAIAQRIYDERTFHDLPFLADALEDAGCTDADILAHCRSGGEHVRGCWVVDLILGKA
jgi:hypothetical protein